MPVPQASGPGAQAAGGGGPLSSLPHGKAQVNPFGNAPSQGGSWDSLLPGVFPSSIRKIGREQNTSAHHRAILDSTFGELEGKKIRLQTHRVFC